MSNMCKLNTIVTAITSSFFSGVVPIKVSTVLILLPVLKVLLPISVVEHILVHILLYTDPVGAFPEYHTLHILMSKLLRNIGNDDMHQSNTSIRNDLGFFYP